MTLDIRNDITTGTGFELKHPLFKKITKPIVTLKDRDLNDHLIALPKEDSVLKVSCIERFHNTVSL